MNVRPKVGFGHGCQMVCLFWMDMFPWLYIVMLGAHDLYKVYMQLLYTYWVCIFLRAQLQVRLDVQLWRNIAWNIPRTTTPKHIQKQTCETYPWDKNCQFGEGHSKTYKLQMQYIQYIIECLIYVDLYSIQYSFVQTYQIAMHLAGMSSIP